MNESESKATQITPLFSNKVLGRVERMRINPICRNTSRHRGEQLAGRGGSNTEFSDYRDYAPGDDTRFIDWNIFSRLRRPYLKIFRLEEEMNIVVIIDGSSSMMFDGKLELAKSLAAAFGVMALFAGQKLSAYLVREGAKGPAERMPPCHGRAHMKNFLRFVESTEGGGNLPLEKGVDQVLKYHKGKGVVILLSDFLTFGNIKRAFNSLFSMGLEIYSLQILSQAEMNPELTGDLRLVDSETDVTLDITAAGDILSIYHEHKDRHMEELLKLSQQRSGRFMTLSSDLSVETVLFDILLKRGWIK